MKTSITACYEQLTGGDSNLICSPVDIALVFAMAPCWGLRPDHRRNPVGPLA